MLAPSAVTTVDDGFFLLIPREVFLETNLSSKCLLAGHEVLELFEKRHFRCDCGNGKFKLDGSSSSSSSSCSIECQLEPSKEAYNLENKYNHNFQGLYCHCGKEYDEEKDFMMGCEV